MLILTTLACGLGQADELTPTVEVLPLAAEETAPTQPVPTEASSIPLEAEMRLEDQGFAIQPLPNYELDTSFGAQMLAPGADPDIGPAFMLMGGTAFEGITAASLIESIESSEVNVTEPQPITVDGYEGLVSEFQRSSGNLSGRVVAVMVTPTQQFVIFGIAPQSQWDADIAPLFEALLRSVDLFEMEAAAENAPEFAELTEIRQWGTGATASSEYGNPNWSAMQATGAPNVTDCSDASEAWAAASSTASNGSNSPLMSRSNRARSTSTLAISDPHPQNGIDRYERGFAPNLRVRGPFVPGMPDCFQRRCDGDRLPGPDVADHN